MKFVPTGILSVAVALAIVPALRAEILVEVFTAKACDVCRPAEAMAGEMARRDDVIAVAMHVDYWDYLEEDPFADPTFGARQVGYNNVGDLKELHTPQIVVNGEVLDNQSEFEASFQALDMQNRDALVKADMKPQGGSIGLALEASPNLPEGQYDVLWMSIYSEAEIKATGEAKAKYLLKDLAVVKLIRTLGNWDGQSQANFSIETEEDEKGVLVVQDRNLGKVVFARMIGAE